MTKSGSDLGDLFEAVRRSPNLTSLQLAQLFPGIETQTIEVGCIDPDTAHPNHVDMAYVVAIARHRRARFIFEFGTYLGRTTYHLALGLRRKWRPFGWGTPSGHVYSLDLDPRSVVAEDIKLGPAIRAVHERGLQGVFFRGKAVEREITQLHGDSRNFDYSPFRKRMDFIFIDADHGYEYVKNDTDRAFEMLAPNGVIAWHDFAPKSPGVVRAIGDILQTRALFHIERTSLVLYVDGVEARTFEPVAPPFARASLKGGSAG